MLIIVGKFIFTFIDFIELSGWKEGGRCCVLRVRSVIGNFIFYVGLVLIKVYFID